MLKSLYIEADILNNMKNKEIFNEHFINIDNNNIATTIKEEGVIFIKNAINTNFVDTLLSDINKNKFSINKNWTTGVYTEKQYFVKHLLGCSKSFYSLISSSDIFDICDKYFSTEYRLKAYRYYETYFNHKMEWHTDNKIGNEFKEIPGIIFIIYLDTVKDGEFQFVKKSHTQPSVKGYNDFSNKQILEEFQNDVLSFKGGKGDLIIYDSYGIHRAKRAINDKNFVRKSLFIQIDGNLNSAESSLLDPSYFDKLDDKSLKYFGFGLPSNNRTYPESNFKRLPIKIFFKDIFSPYILLIISKSIRWLIPKMIKQFIKKNSSNNKKNIDK